MSRYKAYPEYRDSGIEWLGEIPFDWHSTKVKFGYQITLGKMLQKEQREYTQLLRPYLKAVNIQNSGVQVEDVESMWFSPSEIQSLRLKKGDVLISEGGDVGRAAVWKDELPECYIQNAINRARPKGERDGKFLYYWMSMLKSSDYINILCNKATIAHYTVDKLESSPIFLPPNSYAEQIANFLDHETAKIDTLIAKQQELIKLLKEKRQAVISHAVTKGLNPNSPMRDSGVEWFSEIPSSWCVTKLKYLVEQIVDGAHFTPTYVEDGVPFLRVTDIQSAVIDKANIKYIPLNEHNELIKRCRPGRGDLLLSKNGTIGIPKIVDWDWEFSIFVSLCLIRLGKKIDVEYAYFFFLTSQISEQISSLVKQSTVINLHLDKIANFEFTLPPLPQQREIVVYLKESLSNYDSQIDAAVRMSQLLQERRTALISAAVTGKIDVRDWQPPSDVAIAA